MNRFKVICCTLLACCLCCRGKDLGFLEVDNWLIKDNKSATRVVVTSDIVGLQPALDLKRQTLLGRFWFESRNGKERRFFFAMIRNSTGYGGAGDNLIMALEGNKREYSLSLARMSGGATVWTCEVPESEIQRLAGSDVGILVVGKELQVQVTMPRVVVKTMLEMVPK
jgi:hypothetical protein